MRTILDISDQLNQRDEVIHTSNYRRVHCSNIEGKLLSLPSKLGEFEIPIFAEISNQEYEYSLMLSKDLMYKISNKKTKAKTAKTSIKVREH